MNALSDAGLVPHAGGTQRPTNAVARAPKVATARALAAPRCTRTCSSAAAAVRVAYQPPAVLPFRRAPHYISSVIIRTKCGEGCGPNGRAAHGYGRLAVADRPLLRGEEEALEELLDERHLDARRPLLGLQPRAVKSFSCPLSV